MVLNVSVTGPLYQVVLLSKLVVTDTARMTMSRGSTVLSLFLYLLPRVTLVALFLYLLPRVTLVDHTRD